jgi:hypothetical protein
MRGPYVDRYLVPKRGNTMAQCEDAIGLSPDLEPGRRATGPVAAAVCDGASESILAGVWAGQLAAGLVRRSAEQPGLAARPDALAEAIGAAVEAWAGWSVEYVAGREAAGRPIAWYEQPKLDQGAYSTVLAVELAPTRRRGRHADSRSYQPPPRPASLSPAAEAAAVDDLMTVALAVTEPVQWTWRAAALGDTCLFQVRDERLICAFPLDAVESFGLVPPLAGSRNRDRAKLAEHTALADGWCVPGDQLFLATDALAAWFLAEHGRGLRPWELLRDFAGRGGEFAPWVDREREDRRMRNDDVALVHIDFG